MPDMNMASVASHAGFIVKYLLSNWSLDLPVSVPFLLLPIIFYVRGLKVAERKNRETGEVIPGSSTQDVLIFSLGMLILVLAIMSPIMYWAMVYLWMHIVFHILVMLAAPPLIAFSKPWKVMEAGLTPKLQLTVKNLVKNSEQGGAFSTFIRFITNPTVDTLYFVVTMLMWFLPQMMTWAVDNKYAMLAMHITFITSGMLFFTQLIDTYPYRSRVTDPVKRFGMIILAMVVSWLLAMFMGFAPHAWYPVYWNIRGKTLSPVADQQLSASLLWVLCMEPLVYSAYYNIKLWIAMSETNSLVETRRPWLKQG